MPPPLSPAHPGPVFCDFRNMRWYQLFSYLKWCSRVNSWKWERWGKMEIWRVTRREVRCPLVTGLWSILSQLFSDFAAPLTLSTSHFVKAKLCEKNCNTAVFKRAPQTFAHPEHFVALNVFVCESGINSGFDEKRTYKSSLAVCCCLHCVLVFNSFIIKGFSLAAPCWTLSCNGGINWSTEVSAYNYVLSPAHYFTHIQTHTHTHTHCFADRVWMQKGVYSTHTHW